MGIHNPLISQRLNKCNVPVPRREDCIFGVDYVRRDHSQSCLAACEAHDAVRYRLPGRVESIEA